MSYGTGSGRVYFSDLTFAFLEDTNQCVGGRWCRWVAKMCFFDELCEMHKRITLRSPPLLQIHCQLQCVLHVVQRRSSWLSHPPLYL